MTYKPTDHQFRVMQYLDQRGTVERRCILVDCCAETSMIAARAKHNQGRRFIKGSNGAAPMIVAKWMKGMIAAGLACEVRTGSPWYAHQGYKLTQSGRKFVRSYAKGDKEQPDG